ncbi:Phenylalanine--tRNA ligase beta subunit [Diplonema papillatum]|nr:Phenylalanine--tRNA ligase beta subunit [Diplonema papillatum]
MAPWECEDCGQENEDDDQVCCACEIERPVQVDPRYEGYKVGKVTECEDIPKTKLRCMKVDVGSGEEVQVVSNAPNAKTGLLTVVATVGAKVEESGETITVSKTVVGGKPSFGMLCNGPMLGWTGGDNKMAVSLPEGTPGSAPPASRPRGK